MSEFCKIEKLPYCDKFVLPIWLDLDDDKFEIKEIYFQSRYAAQKFRKTHTIINNEIVPIN